MSTQTYESRIKEMACRPERALIGSAITPHHAYGLGHTTARLDAAAIAADADAELQSARQMARHRLQHIEQLEAKIVDLMGQIRQQDKCPKCEKEERLVRHSISEYRNVWNQRAMRAKKPDSLDSRRSLNLTSDYDATTLARMFEAAFGGETTWARTPMGQVRYLIHSSTFNGVLPFDRQDRAWAYVHKVLDDQTAARISHIEGLDTAGHANQPSLD